MKRLIACAVVVASGRAAAQPVGAQAEVLFRQGKTLMAEGKIAEACAAFDASQRLDPADATLFNQAKCRDLNSQHATAWGLFLAAERATRGSTDPTRVRLRDVALENIARIEPILSTLTIVVTDEVRVGGLEILRDGERVDQATWNAAMPVDGAAYRITARAPGNAEWTAVIAVDNERDAKTVAVPRLKASPLASRTTVTGPALEMRSSRAWPIAVGGGALALLGAAIGFELSGRWTYDDARSTADRARRDDLETSANHRRYAAEAFAVTGSIATGIAVWLFVRQPVRRNVIVVPTGIALRGDF